MAVSRYVTLALDVLIGFYTLAIILILLTGGIEAGWLRATSVAKPLLVLWVLVPIRLTIRGIPFCVLRSAFFVLRSPFAVLRSRASAIPVAVTDAAFAFVVTRLAADAVAMLVTVLFPSERTPPFSLPFAAVKFAGAFAAWDSGWYFDIATRGYYYSADGQSSIAFFPLYPMAMRALAWPFGSSEAAVWAAGIAISYAALLGGLIALHRFVFDVFADRELARRTVLYVAVFPFSFFLSRVYPEGLFFLLTVLAVSAAHRGRWWQAGLWGGLAALTRPQGILIGVPLALMAMRGAGGRQLVARGAALAPIALAFAVYNLYIASLAGHPLAWLSTETQWGYSLGHPPWEQLAGLIERVVRYGLHDYFLTSNLAPYRLLQGATALVLVALMPLVFVRAGAPLGAYVLVSLLVPLSGNALEGIGRYAAVLFPVFMALATVKSVRFHEALLIASAVFLALFAGLFATWRPIY